MEEDLATIRTGVQSLLKVIGEALREVRFGPTIGEQQSGLLFGLAGQHIANMLVLVAPESSRGWVSAYPLARMSGDCCIRSLYLSFCQDDDAYERSLKRLLEDRSNPFGEFKDLIARVRQGLLRRDLLTIPGIDAVPTAQQVASLLHEDWSTLSSLTHGGEVATRLLRQAITNDSGEPDELTKVVLIRTIHLLAQTAVLLLRGYDREKEALQVSLAAQNHLAKFDTSSFTETDDATGSKG